MFILERPCRYRRLFFPFCFFCEITRALEGAPGRGWSACVSFPLSGCFFFFFAGAHTHMWNIIWRVGAAHSGGSGAATTRHAGAKPEQVGENTVAESQIKTTLVAKVFFRDETVQRRRNRGCDQLLHRYSGLCTCVC